MDPSRLLSRRPSLVLRLALAALALVVLWLAVGTYRQWRSRFAELEEIAETSGVASRRPALVASMRRDAGPTRAALRLARALLADELDQRWIQDLPPDERTAETRRGLERLDTAHRLGTEALEQRPGSWEARLVIGGAEYLRLSRRHDPRLQHDRQSWLRPLQEAHRLAPLQPEPLRFLAATDLGNWSVLSEQERAAAVERLQRAFEDPTTFDLLSPAWLRVAPSLDRALSVVPDTLGAWNSLGRYFARRGDWERYRDARLRADAALHGYSETLLAEAQARLRGADRRVGVMRLSWVGANAEPDAANVQLIERVLALAPPGFGSDANQPWLNAWFDWARDRCLSEPVCPLTPEALLRLLSLRRDVSPAEHAWALAAAGELRPAEALEREERKRHAGPLGAEWTSYVLTKASLLAGRGAGREALEALRRVPLVSRDSARYWARHRSIASAAGDRLEVATAQAWLDGVARERWNPDDWTRGRFTAKLELWPARRASGLRLRIRGAANHRGILTVRWDGSLVDRIPAVDGRQIDLPVEVGLGRHLLAITAELGAEPAVAEARLLPLDR